MRSVSLFEIQRLHQLGPRFLAKLFGIAEPVFYTVNMKSRVVHMWLRYLYRGLPERNLFAQIGFLQTWSPNSVIVTVLSCFFCAIGKTCLAECWGRERTTISLGVEGRLCKDFLPEQKICIFCFTDVATVSIIEFTDRRGTHRGFVLGAEQQVLSHRRQQFISGRSVKFVFSASGMWKKTCSSWSALFILRFLLPAMVHLYSYGLSPPQYVMSSSYPEHQIRSCSRHGHGKAHFSLEETCAVWWTGGLPAHHQQWYKCAAFLVSCSHGT